MRSGCRTARSGCSSRWRPRRRRAGDRDQHALPRARGAGHPDPLRGHPARVLAGLPRDRLRRDPRRGRRRRGADRRPRAAGLRGRRRRPRRALDGLHLARARPARRSSSSTPSAGWTRTRRAVADAFGYRGGVVLVRAAAVRRVRLLHLPRRAARRARSTSSSTSSTPSAPRQLIARARRHPHDRHRRDVPAPVRAPHRTRCARPASPPSTSIRARSSTPPTSAGSRSTSATAPPRSRRSSPTRRPTRRPRSARGRAARRSPSAIDVRIVDDEIQVKGPNVMAGYLNEDEARAPSPTTATTAPGTSAARRAASASSTSPGGGDALRLERLSRAPARDRGLHRDARRRRGGRGGRARRAPGGVRRRRPRGRRDRALSSASWRATRSRAA